jgi:death-on-curing protein
MRLKIEQVLYLHFRLVDELGGRHGVRDPALLERALQARGSLWIRVAALVRGISAGRPFRDGNRRTACAAAALLLHLHGYAVRASPRELLGAPDRIRRYARRTLKAPRRRR